MDKQITWVIPLPGDFVVVSPKLHERLMYERAKFWNSLKGKTWVVHKMDELQAIEGNEAVIGFIAYAKNGRTRTHLLRIPIEAVKKLGSEFGYGPGYESGTQKRLQRASRLPLTLTTPNT